MNQPLQEAAQTPCSRPGLLRPAALANLPGPHRRPPAQNRADVCPEAVSPQEDNPGHRFVLGDPCHTSKLQLHRGPSAPAWSAALRLSAPELREARPPRSQAPRGQSSPRREQAAASRSFLLLWLLSSLSRKGVSLNVVFPVFLIYPPWNVGFPESVDWYHTCCGNFLASTHL